jgi:hypothetical protein
VVAGYLGTLGHMSKWANVTRNLIAPVGFGAIAPTVLVGVWGVLVAAIWLPSFRYLWTSHRINMNNLPVDVTWAFDALGGALIGVATSVVLVRIVRGHFLRAWLLFAFAFTVSAIAPELIDGEFELPVWFFVQPLIVFFASATIVVFALRAHFQSLQNVP